MVEMVSKIDGRERGASQFRLSPPGCLLSIFHIGMPSSLLISQEYLNGLRDASLRIDRPSDQLIFTVIVAVFLLRNLNRRDMLSPMRYSLPVLQG